MNKKETLKEVVRYWVEKAGDSIQAAEDELKAGRLSFAVNRIYYACFYIVSAALLQENLKFSKHSGVRAAFHQHFVRPGRVSLEYGEFYDQLFEARQRGDYMELVIFEKLQVEEWLEQGKRFINAMKLLIEQ